MTIRQIKEKEPQFNFYMKRLLLPLLAALALPTAVNAESDCFYSNQKEYEDLLKIRT